MTPAPRPAVVLVVAKAPVPGRVKTRLGASTGMKAAADLAAASLLDTLAACAAAYGEGRRHLALDGDLAEARRGEEIRSALAGWQVHPQRGDGLAARLTAAHTDVSEAAGAPVVQVGMDTPHAPVATLRAAADLLTGPDDAVLGPAHDGGWWLLGVAGPHLLVHLPEVPMSTDATGARTLDALARAGGRVHQVEALRDVDELADASAVAQAAPQSRFAAALAELGLDASVDPGAEPAAGVRA
ncbi:TIGR04282 family arsenosugar biosynthesis glycosyltransferase [Nocardioides aurantiacus]|uniref:TIGR04282 family arsenosugar biosynthesis glycosyltransferase n=1 Tax=Nocardioides aurantiacus TaxID=86796 RepID=UPI00403EF72D